MVVHVGVELGALALLHEPLLVLVTLLLDGERLGVHLHVREHEASSPERECE